jgi:hypothetical protein
MSRRGATALTALTAFAALAAVVALSAQAGTAANRSVAPTTVLHAVDGSRIHGAVGFAPTPGGTGTTVALTVHGLPAGADVEARLHAGRTLDRLSASSTPLPSGPATESGSFRGESRVLFRWDHDVRIGELTDGGHTVVVLADGRFVAYAHVPRQ